MTRVFLQPYSSHDCAPVGHTGKMCL